MSNFTVKKESQHYLSQVTGTDVHGDAMLRVCPFVVRDEQETWSLWFSSSKLVISVLTLENI